MLNLVGHEGVAMIAVSGLDMAAWDAVAKTAEVRLARNERRPIMATYRARSALGGRKP